MARLLLVRLRKPFSHQASPLMPFLLQQAEEPIPRLPVEDPIGVLVVAERVGQALQAQLGLDVLERGAADEAHLDRAELQPLDHGRLGAELGVGEHLDLDAPGRDHLHLVGEAGSGDVPVVRGGQDVAQLQDGRVGGRRCQDGQRGDRQDNGSEPLHAFSSS